MNRLINVRAGVNVFLDYIFSSDFEKRMSG